MQMMKINWKTISLLLSIWSILMIILVFPNISWAENTSQKNVTNQNAQAQSQKTQSENTNSKSNGNSQKANTANSEENSSETAKSASNEIEFADGNVILSNLDYPNVKDKHARETKLIPYIISGTAGLICLVGVILGISSYRKSKEIDDYENDFSMGNDSDDKFLTGFEGLRGVRTVADEDAKPKAITDLEDEAASEKPKALQALDDEKKFNELQKANEEKEKEEKVKNDANKILKETKNKADLNSLIQETQEMIQKDVKSYEEDKAPNIDDPLNLQKNTIDYEKNISEIFKTLDSKLDKLKKLQIKDVQVQDENTK